MERQNGVNNAEDCCNEPTGEHKQEHAFQTTWFQSWYGNANSAGMHMNCSFCATMCSCCAARHLPASTMLNRHEKRNSTRVTSRGPTLAATFMDDDRTLHSVPNSSCLPHYNSNMPKALHNNTSLQRHSDSLQCIQTTARALLGT